ncbi:MAG: response regulator transcription factor [Caldilineaceae bacterium]|nr:response regulator transcription factor [Caldilineaceae bacterium]
MSDPRSPPLLIIDGHPGTVEQLRELLTRGEIDFVVAANGLEGVQMVYHWQPRLILLSLVLPGMDGWETLAEIRALSNAPVILLANTYNSHEVARGFDEGAFDVIVKPVVPHVLLARIRSVLRLPRPPTRPDICYADDYLRLDPQTQRAYVQQKEVKLSTIERKLLFFLFAHAGQVCPFEQILEHVWGADYSESDQYVHIYISRLRKKLEIDPRRPHYILTEHGAGYRFRLAALES